MTCLFNSFLCAFFTKRKTAFRDIMQKQQIFILRSYKINKINFEIEATTTIFFWLFRRYIQMEINFLCRI